MIELRSKTDRTGAIVLKMNEWVANGAHLAWLIEPQRRAVTIYRPGRAPEVLLEPKQVPGEGPIAGFVLDTTDLWMPR